jgi:hypothetical protein
MNIAQTISAGGPGSGCHGPNCGRPLGSGIGKASERHIAERLQSVSKDQYRNLYRLVFVNLHRWVLTIASLRADI